MGKSNYASNGILALIFQGTPWDVLAQNSSIPATSLYVALHTADPGPNGLQNTNEVYYSGYSRVGVLRSSIGWSVPTQQFVHPNAGIVFPIGNGGGFSIATYWSIGTLPGGSVLTDSQGNPLLDAAGNMLYSSGTGAGSTPIIYSGPIVPSIVCGNGVTPLLTTASIVTES